MQIEQQGDGGKLKQKIKQIETRIFLCKNVQNMQARVIVLVHHISC